MNSTRSFAKRIERLFQSSILVGLAMALVVTPRNPSDPSTVTVVVTFGILFICVVSVTAWGYHVQVNSDRKVQVIREELRKSYTRTVPPPDNWTPPQLPLVAPDPKIP